MFRHLASFRLGIALATSLAFADLLQAADPRPSLSIVQTESGRRLTWPGTPAGFVLEASGSLAPGAAWDAVTTGVLVQGGTLVFDLTGAGEMRFYRLRLAGEPVTTVIESSPAIGEVNVAVTRETVLLFSGPLAPGTLLTPEGFFAEFGGRRLLTRAELGADLKSATLFFLEDLPGGARIRVRFDGDAVLDAAGKALDADGDGVAGGTGIIEFDTLGLTPVPGTAVIGRVFASELAGDNSVNRPLEGVTITVDGAEETLRTQTDADGNFKLEPCPSGRFFVHVDGRTAKGSHWPTNDYYPFIGKAWEAIAGRADNLANGTGEIFLPLIVPETLQRISAVSETKIEFPATVLARNPDLAGVSITVPPNALYSDNGTRGGRVGIAPVSPDRLPEPLPEDLKFALVITVQTDGPQNFSQPVPVRFPNLPDPRTGQKLPPGAKTALWSFDHDLGDWEIVGPMTVTPDGNFVVTDAGVGIRKPGWHGTQPGTRGRRGNIRRRCEPQDCRLGSIGMTIGVGGKRTFTVQPGHTPGLVRWSAPTARGARRQTGDSFTALFCQPGEHTVTATLTPECGEPCQQSLSFLVAENDVPECLTGYIPVHSPPFKRGELIPLDLLDSDGSPILGEVEWTAEGGTPNHGTSLPAQVRFCTPGTHLVRWTVTTPCGTTCSEFQPFEVENTACGLSPLTVGLGGPKLGEDFVLSTTATSPGTITWDAGGATVLPLEGPTELPWEAGPNGYDAFAGFRFCTPGRKTIRATLRTPCGEVCSQEFTVDISGAACALDPLEIGLGNLRVGESFAVFTAANRSGRISWEAGPDGTFVDLGPDEVPQGGSFEGVAIIRFCTPGTKTIKARLVTSCGDTCEQQITTTIQGAICDLDAPQVGLGELRVGHPIVINSGSDAVGDIRWDAGDGVVMEPGPLSLPDSVIGRNAFAMVRFCTPGTKTVHVTITTRCGDSCSKSVSFQIADTPCELQPFVITAPSGNPRAGEPFAISTAVSQEGTVTWDLVGGRNSAPLEQEVNLLDLRSIMVATFDAAGVYGVTATLRTRCGTLCSLVVPIAVDPPAAASPSAAANDQLLASLRADLVRAQPSGWWGQEPTAAEHTMLAQLDQATDVAAARRGRISPQGDLPLVASQGLHYYLIQNLATGRLARGKAGARGVAHPRGVVLAANTRYREYLLNANGSFLGSAEFTTPGNGQQFDLPDFLLEEATRPDGDNDGLPDLAELILGSDATRADSDGDGISDAEEAREGTNLAGTDEQPDGLLASVSLPGRAVDVATDDNLAVVALGGSGVAVLNILNGLPPALIAIVDTPGNATAVACGDGFAAATLGEDGLAIIALQDPANVRITRQVHLDSASKAVAIAAGTAYVGLESGEVLAVDLLSGRTLAGLTLGTSVQDLCLAGDDLYALTEGSLRVIPLLGNFAATAVVGAPGTRGAGGLRLRLHGGGDRLYATYAAGLNVFDLTQPGSPTLLRHTQTTQFGWKQLVANGSGLALAAVDAVSTPEGPHDVSLYDLRPDGTNDQFVTTFSTPGFAAAVAIHQGLGYVADGASGLQVVRYQGADTRKIPPTAALRSRFTDGKAEENTLATFTAVVTDDVEVRAVEFYVDGALVARDGGFPFEYRFVVPRLTPSKSSFRIRARAIDTGGNTSDSPSQDIQIIGDVTPPAVRQVTPRSGTTNDNRPVDTVTATFSEPIDPATLTGARLQLFAAGPDGKLDTADDVLVPTGALSYSAEVNTAVLSFSPGLPIGSYRGLVGPGLADQLGNATSTAFKWTFTVSGPKIVDRLPRPAGFVGGQFLTVTFNGPMDPASFTPDRFKLLNAGPDGILGNTDDFTVTRGVFSYDAERFTARLAFEPPLFVNRFRFVLSSNLTDVAGNQLKTDEVWDFRTLQPSLVVNNTLQITANFALLGQADEFGLTLPGGVPIALGNPSRHRLSLRTPAGEPLFADETSDLLKFTAPTQGMYYLLCDNGPSFAGLYNLFLGRFTTNTIPVDLSTAEEYRFTDATARAIGDLLIFELTLPPKSAFFLEWDLFGSSQRRFTMFDPSGQVLFTGTSGAEDNQVWRTTAGGRYRFAVELTGTKPPAFAIKRALDRSFDVDLTGLSTFTSITNLNVPGSIHTYHLTIPAGAPFVFLARNTFVCPDWELTDSTGKPLFDNLQMCGDTEFPDLSRGGSYTLRITGTLLGYGDYNFTVLKPGTTTTAHDLTATRHFADSGRLEIPGARRAYEFTLGAGEAWRLLGSAGGKSGSGTLWRLMAPDGSVLFGLELAAGSVHELVTPAAGVYRLTLDHSGDLQDLGEFSVNLDRFTSSAGAWLQLTHQNGPTNETFAAALFNGQIIVAGPFADGSSVARREGEAWVGLGHAEKLNGDPAAVFALLARGGDLYAGGDFQRLGGVAANGIARWDGTHWNPLGQGIDVSPVDFQVRALAFRGTELFVGGRFRTAGSVSAKNLARWTGTDWTTVTWFTIVGFPPEEGIGGRPDTTEIVRALADFNGALMVGGDFQFPGNDLLAINADGQLNNGPFSVDGFVGPGRFDPAEIRSLAVTTGRLAAGGDYHRVNTRFSPLRVEHAASWDGAQWTAFAGGLDAPVNAIAADGNMTYAGGRFTFAGVQGQTGGTGTLANGIARWDGKSWTTFGFGVAAPAPLRQPAEPGTVNGLLPLGNQLVVVGNFTVANGLPAPFFGIWQAQP